MRRLAWFLLLSAASFGSAERINHAGRILGALQTPTVATLFNTPQADAILSTLQVFPTSSAWNEVIINRPLLPNSAAMIAMIRSELATNRRNFRAFYEMNFALVPNNQPLVPIDFITYPDESDPGPYPIPANQPIELWPVNTEGQTLDQWQRDVYNWGGDRHGLMVQPGTGDLYETWQMKKLASGAWQASNGAKFDLDSNAMRPAGWTSGDAAGLPMFPALVRYDEVQRGEIEHALRLVVKHTRRAYLYPARHHASSPSTTDPNVPAMGERLRLKASFVIPTSWSDEAKCVARALKKYGAIVADNGNFFQTSITPDDRWPAGCFDDLWNIDVNDFEVVQTTGENEGPRSPNPPTANAGADRTTSVGAAIALNGSVSNGNPSWYRYSGPAGVSFSNPNAATTMATFSAAGVYTLMLKVENGVHTPAFDAVVVTVNSGPTITSVSFLPNPVYGGYTTTGRVQLSAPAPNGGAAISLTDNLSIFSTPTGVNIPAGQSSATFPASASVVSSSFTGNVIARLGSVQRIGTITIQPGPLVQSVVLNPTSVVGGTNSTGTVVLSKPAPIGGTRVNLTDNQSAVTLPAFVTIPEGQIQGVFSASTVPVVAPLTAFVHAAVPGSSRGANLGVLAPILLSVSVSPSSVKGGLPSTGLVRLTGNAAATVSILLSVNGSVASVPPNVNIAMGTREANFTVNTIPVTTTRTLSVIAKLGTVQKTATLTITP